MKLSRECAIHARQERYHPLGFQCFECGHSFWHWLSPYVRHVWSHGWRNMKAGAVFCPLCYHDW